MLFRSLPSSPISMCTPRSFSSRLVNKYLSPVMCKDTPLSRNHTEPIILETKHVINEKSSSNYEAKASPATDLAACLFFFFYGQFVAVPAFSIFMFLSLSLSANFLWSLLLWNKSVKAFHIKNGEALP